MVGVSGRLVTRDGFHGTSGRDEAGGSLLGAMYRETRGDGYQGREVS